MLNTVENRVGIVAECVCDLPKSILQKYDIDLVYFLIETDTGIFTDTDEITAENILSYMAAGGEKSISSAPSPQVYRAVFEKKLKKNSEVILVAISSEISDSCKNAMTAIEEMGAMGRRVNVFDSRHLSTGLGHLVLKAADLAENGESSGEILRELEKMRDKVCTSFITEKADFLYRNGRISERVKKACDIFSIHPVLAMRDGKLTLKSVKFGSYKKASAKYVKDELKNAESIDKKRVFITHAGCSVKKIEDIKRDVARICEFDELIVTKASATVSSNCGPNAFGILFART